MDLEVPAATLAALLLGTARATGFVLLAPPFNSRSIPAPVKGAFAMALSLLLSTQIAPSMPEVTAGFLVVAAVTEVVIGAGLGFVSSCCSPRCRWLATCSTSPVGSRCSRPTTPWR